MKKVRNDINNYIGQRFGTVVVTRLVGRKYRPNGTAYLVFEIRCDCGTVREVSSQRFRKQDQIKSCGCLNFTGPHGNTKLTPAEASIRGIANRYARSAEDRGIEWALSIDAVRSLIFRSCHWCGVPPNTKFNRYITKDGTRRSDGKKILTDANKAAWITMNGIDRINNSKGYLASNVVPCCEHCNRAKRDLPIEVWSAWLKRITEHQKCAAY